VEAISVSFSTDHRPDTPVLQIVAPTEQTLEVAPISLPTDRRPNPLTNLPAWHWPLTDDQEKTKKLDDPLPPNPAITIDREYSLNRLANSIDLTAEQKRFVLQAYSFLPQQQIDEDEELLTPLLDHPPDNSDQYQHLAVLVLSKLPDLAARVEPVFRRAIELKPKSAVPWCGLGILFTNFLNRYEEAESAFRKAAALDPKSVVPWCGLGILFTNHLNRYGEAETAYRKAIELDPKSAVPWNGLGTLLMVHLNRYEEAETAYRWTIELDLKYADPWNSLGLLHRTLHRDCEEAFRCFTEGLAKAEPDSLDTAYLWMNLGRLELVRGRPEQARESLRRALDLFDQQPGFQVHALWLAVALAGPTGPEDDSHSAAEAETGLTRQRSQHWWNAIPGWRGEVLEKDPKSTAARSSLFIASLTAGEANEALWQEVLSQIETHQDRFGLIDDLYLFAGLRPDAAQRVAALLALPAEQVARFRDQPMPADWLERYRPFAEGRSRGAGDPADHARFCHEDRPSG